MNTSMIKQFLPAIKLIPVQEQALPGVLFLYAGGRMSGRSFLQAYALIEAAFRQHGEWIEVRDHTGKTPADNHLMDMIKAMIMNSPVEPFRKGFEFKAWRIRFRTEDYEWLGDTLNDNNT